MRCKSKGEMKNDSVVLVWAIERLELPFAETGNTMRFLKTLERESSDLQ